MKKSIRIIVVLILLISQSCKGQSDNSKLKSIQGENIENVKNNSQNDSLYKYLEWEFIDNKKEIYKANNQTIQLKKFINESQALAGKKLHLNKIEIDTIITDAYKIKPYLFINNDEKILLLEESAEDGIWGYRFYLVHNDRLIKKDFLNIAPIDDNIKINDFILLSKNKNNVVVKLKTESYYNFELEKIEKSNSYLHLIKTEKSIYKVLSIEKKKENDNLTGSHFSLPIKK